MTPVASTSRKVGILVASAMAGLFTLQCKAPTLGHNILSKIKCAECGEKIPEGRAGRRCKSCREKNLVWRT